MLIAFNENVMVLVILDHLSNAKEKKVFLSSDHKTEKCH